MANAGKCRSFTMSTETQRRSLVRLIVPITLLAVISLGAGYYFAAAKNPNATVQWSANPLMIKFNASGSFSGSASDSFTCQGRVSPVTLQTTSSQPNIISITVTPSSFSTCSSTPDVVVVKASCTPAFLNTNCDGDQYTGTVQVCGPSPYTCLQSVLTVTVAVTTKPCPCPVISG